MEVPGEPKSCFIDFPRVLCELLSRLELLVCAPV